MKLKYENIKILFLVILLFLGITIVIPFSASNLIEFYQKKDSYDTCENLENISNDPDSLHYISNTLEQYFNSLIVKKSTMFSEDSIQLYGTSSILNSSFLIDENIIGLQERIPHYIAFINDNGEKRLGIWVQRSFLAFKVLDVLADDEVILDENNLEIKCWQAKKLLGERS